jgi:hypothetical protein
MVKTSTRYVSDEDAKRLKEVIESTHNLIGSLEEIKSVYYLGGQINKLEFDDPDDTQGRHCRTYDFEFYVYAGSFKEVEDMVTEELQKLNWLPQEIGFFDIERMKDFNPEIHLLDCRITSGFKVFGSDGKIDPKTKIIGYRGISDYNSSNFFRD